MVRTQAFFLVFFKRDFLYGTAQFLSDIEWILLSFILFLNGRKGRQCIEFCQQKFHEARHLLKGGLIHI